MHTQGDWVVVESQHEGTGLLIECYQAELYEKGEAELPSVIVAECDPLPEQLHNARLIAAAPDLYEACKSALRLQCFHSDELSNDEELMYKWLSDAINKAEGVTVCDVK